MRIEPMKRHLAPALFSLSLCAVMGGVQTAGAQAVSVAPALAIDTTTTVSIASVVAPADPLPTAPAPARVTIMTPAPVGVTATRSVPADAPTRPAAAAFDWKMPTSRALMIGGAATAIVGLVAIQGDTGAIVALGGTAVAVYGLYLHYSR
jgi:hypothetical protein